MNDESDKDYWNCFIRNAVEIPPIIGSHPVSFYIIAEGCKNALKLLMNCAVNKNAILDYLSQPFIEYIRRYAEEVYSRSLKTYKNPENVSYKVLHPTFKDIIISLTELIEFNTEFYMDTILSWILNIFDKGLKQLNNNVFLAFIRLKSWKYCNPIEVLESFLKSIFQNFLNVDDVSTLKFFENLVKLFISRGRITWLIVNIAGWVKYKELLLQVLLRNMFFSFSVKPVESINFFRNHFNEINNKNSHKIFVDFIHILIFKDFKSSDSEYVIGKYGNLFQINELSLNLGRVILNLINIVLELCYVSQDFCNSFIFDLLHCMNNKDNILKMTRFISSNKLFYVLFEDHLVSLMLNVSKNGLEFYNLLFQILSKENLILSSNQNYKIRAKSIILRLTNALFLQGTKHNLTRSILNNVNYDSFTNLFLGIMELKFSLVYFKWLLQIISTQDAFYSELNADYRLFLVHTILLTCFNYKLDTCVIKGHKQLISKTMFTTFFSSLTTFYLFDQNSTSNVVLGLMQNIDQYSEMAEKKLFYAVVNIGYTLTFKFNSMKQPNIHVWDMVFDLNKNFYPLYIWTIRNAHKIDLNTTYELINLFKDNRLENFSSKVVKIQNEKLVDSFILFLSKISENFDPSNLNYIYGVMLFSTCVDVKICQIFIQKIIGKLFYGSIISKVAISSFGVSHFICFHSLTFITCTKDFQFSKFILMTFMQYLFNNGIIESKCILWPHYNNLKFCNKEIVTCYNIFKENDLIKHFLLIISEIRWSWDFCLLLVPLIAPLMTYMLLEWQILKGRVCKNKQLYENIRFMMVFCCKIGFIDIPHRIMGKLYDAEPNSYLYVILLYTWKYLQKKTWEKVSNSENERKIQIIPREWEISLVSSDDLFKEIEKMIKIHYLENIDKNDDEIKEMFALCM